MPFEVTKTQILLIGPLAFGETSISFHLGRDLVKIDEGPTSPAAFWWCLKGASMFWWFHHCPCLKQNFGGMPSFQRQNKQMFHMSTKFMLWLPFFCTSNHVVPRNWYVFQMFLMNLVVFVNFVRPKLKRLQNVLRMIYQKMTLCCFL